MTCFPQQLKSLGYLCGLVSESGPNSEDLNRTVDLLAGLGAERPETGMVGAEAQLRMPEPSAPTVRWSHGKCVDLCHHIDKSFPHLRVCSACF